MMVRPTVRQKQFDAAAEANNWTPSDKATTLLLSLREEAVEVLQTLFISSINFLYTHLSQMT